MRKEKYRIGNFWKLWVREKMKKMSEECPRRWIEEY
jgi:hypothetical protein